MRPCGSARRVGVATPEADRPLLRYTTGRLLNDTVEVIASTDLPEPDFAICGVGTIIYDVKAATSDAQGVLGRAWRRAGTSSTIERIVQATTDARRQPPQFQHRYKSSWYLEAAEDADDRAARGPAQCRGGDRQCRVLQRTATSTCCRKMANKGNALRWLIERARDKCRRGGRRRRHRQRCGDVPGPRCPRDHRGERPAGVVRAHRVRPTYQAQEHFADGVLEGLQHFGVLERDAPTTTTR